MQVLGVMCPDILGKKKSKFFSFLLVPVSIPGDTILQSSGNPVGPEGESRTCGFKLCPLVLFLIPS